MSNRQPIVEFEREMSARGRSVGLYDGAGYADPNVDLLWQFWQEAVKQERELCAVECERVFGPDERGARACAVLIRGRDLQQGD